MKKPIKSVPLKKKLITMCQIELKNVLIWEVATTMKDNFMIIVIAQQDIHAPILKKMGNFCQDVFSPLHVKLRNTMKTQK